MKLVLVLILVHQRRSPLSVFQLKQPDNAAAAAHTFFLANPEHVEMGENLEQYKDVEGVQEDHFVDREARPHQVGLGDSAKTSPSVQKWLHPPLSLSSFAALLHGSCEAVRQRGL